MLNFVLATVILHIFITGHDKLFVLISNDVPQVCVYFRHIRQLYLWPTMFFRFVNSSVNITIIILVILILSVNVFVFNDGCPVIHLPTSFPAMGQRPSRCTFMSGGQYIFRKQQQQLPHLILYCGAPLLSSMISHGFTFSICTCVPFSSVRSRFQVMASQPHLLFKDLTFKNRFYLFFFLSHNIHRI